MNEPKKRGRPSNAEKAARELVRAADVLIEAHEAHVGPRLLAQAYAMRVWEGQSPSAMDTTERLQRVREALEGQNLPTEGVTLPGDLKL